MTKFLVFISNPEMYNAGTPVGRLLDLEDYDSNEELLEAVIDVAGEDFEATEYTLPFPFDPKTLPLEVVLEKIYQYKSLTLQHGEQIANVIAQHMGTVWDDYYYVTRGPYSTLRELGESFAGDDNPLSRYLNAAHWVHYMKEKGFDVLAVPGCGYVACCAN